MSKQEIDERYQNIKDKIGDSNLSEEEKSDSVKHIEEWYAEDRSFGSLYEELAEISPNIEAFLQELGLI